MAECIGLSYGSIFPPTGVYLPLLGSFSRFSSKKRSPDFKIHRTAGYLCPFDTYMFQTIFSLTPRLNGARQFARPLAAGGYAQVNSLECKKD